MTDAVTKLNRIRDAIMESIMEMTPEELRQSFIDDGEDPDQIVAEQREMIARIIRDQFFALSGSPASPPDQSARQTSADENKGPLT